MMSKQVESLMGLGTIGGIFLAVLLIAVVWMSGKAYILITNQLKANNKLIQDQLAAKDARILNLENDVKELQRFTQHELVDMIMSTQKLIQRGIDSQERVEKLFINSQFNKSMHDK